MRTPPAPSALRIITLPPYRTGPDAERCASDAVISANIRALDEILESDPRPSCARRELQEARRAAMEPFAVPSTFAGSDERIRTVMRQAAEWQSRVTTERRRTEDEVLLTRLFQARGLAYYRHCAQLVLLHEQRSLLLPELLSEARLWADERLEKEVAARHTERSGVSHELYVFAVDLFTAEAVPVPGAVDSACRFLSRLIPELETLLRARSGIEDGSAAVEALVARIAAGIQTEALLRQRCEELKGVFPPEFGASIDRSFREAIEELRERR